MSGESTAREDEGTARPRSAWWVRALAALPLSWLHALASFVALLAARVAPYRYHVVRENLGIAFPELDEAGIRALANRYYAGYADVMFEIVKSASMTREDFARHVTIRNLQRVHERLALGRPVLLVAAHQCNWEWMLLALSLQLGHPLDAAYKPLVDPWAERASGATARKPGSDEYCDVEC